MSAEHKKAGIPELVRFSGRILANLPGISHAREIHRNHVHKLEERAMGLQDFQMIREVETHNSSEIFLLKRGSLLALFASPPLSALAMANGDYAITVTLFLASCAVIRRVDAIIAQKEMLFKAADKRGLPGLRLFDCNDQTKAIANRLKQTANSS